MANPQMVMYEEEFNQIQAVVDRLVREANAKVVFIVDKNGQLIAASGDIDNVDTTSLASLTAGNIAATGGMAKLLKENPYTYQQHVAPHEMAVQEFRRGLTRLETARNLGIDFTLAPRQSVEEGIDAVMANSKLDALVCPTDSPAWPTDFVLGDHLVASASTLPAVAGYPHVTVPMGFVSGLPVGLSFFGRAWSEPVLLKLAYAYEQATRLRKPPQFHPTLDLSHL